MICPNCKSEQIVSEGQYGALFTCPSCQAVYFINFSGEPEYSDQNDQQNEFDQLQQLGSGQIPTPAELSDLSPTSDDLEALDKSLDSTLDEVMTMPKIPISALNEAPIENDLQNDLNPFALPNLTEEPTAANDSFQQLPELGLNPVDTIPHVSEINRPEPSALISSGGGRQKKTQTNPNTGFLDIAKEIADFGNTDTQIAQLNYDLVVSGLDTGEIRKLFIEAIQDSRFGWDAAEVVRSIRHGEVHLKQLNPAKAYVLAKRLQFIDLEQKWTQNANS